MFDKIKYKLKRKLKSWLDIDICENFIELINNTTNRNFDKVLDMIKVSDYKLEAYSKNVDSKISHYIKQ